MKLNYQYRIYPYTQQIQKLNGWLRICRYLYNRWLGQCLNCWETHRCPVNACPLVCHLPELSDNPCFLDLKAQLPELKQDLILVQWSGELLDLKSVYSTVLQDVYVSRLKKALDRYLKPDQAGKRSGRPRIKSEASYRSFKFPQVKQHWLDVRNAVLRLPGIGGIQIRLHRPLPEGFTLKTIQVIKKGDGWYVNLCLEDPTVPTFTPDEIEATWENSVGMDAVLHESDYLALSDGQKLPALKSFRQSQAKLAKIAQRKAARKRKSSRRRKLAKREARLHQKIARARKDHAFNTAHRLLRCGKRVFFHEDLELKNLSKRNQPKLNNQGEYLPNGQAAKSGLNKSWNDAAFGNFFQTLKYRAAKAGVKVVAVRPNYTSQLLSYRDEVVFTDCSMRQYWDEVEQVLVDRDINAAINIKRVGLGLFPTINSRSGNIKIGVSQTESTAKEVLRSLKGLQKPTLTR